MNKFLCLSFDDGPNVESGDTTMNDMLDILEEYNVPASFFLIGNKITDENKSVIQRAIKLGCDIENHSWTHPKMAELSKEEIEAEYEKCDNAILTLICCAICQWQTPNLIKKKEKVLEIKIFGTRPL